jgi:hypothetical protein
MADAPQEAVDRLYGLALGAFVPERDAMAKELRGAGRREEATAVKALAKPTVAAWAVNQAVRSQGKAASALWKAGDALAATQEAVLGGKGSGTDLRAAAEDERLAVEALVDAARGLLTTSGGDLSEATIERVRETLHAAAIDPDARDEVAAGHATRERAPRGLFGGEAVTAPPRTGRRKAEPAPEPAGPRGRKGAPAAKPKAGEAAARTRAAAAKPKAGEVAPARKGAREEAAERRREQAAAREREREEAAARRRARKAAADRAAKAQRVLADAQSRAAKAAERLEEARDRERAAADALAEAQAELDEA